VLGSFWLAGWSLPLPPGGYLAAISRWFLFGLPDGNFPPLGQGWDSILFNAGVAWSLRVEWLFYLSLPLLFVFATERRALAMLAGVALIQGLIVQLRLGDSLLKGFPLLRTLFVIPVLDFFGYMVRGLGFGILASILRKKWRIAELLRGHVGALVVAAGTLLFYLAFEVYTVRDSLILFAVFFPIALGSSFFGVLRSRFLLFAGRISYSVYLLHGIVLNTIWRIVSAHAPLGGVSPAAFVAINAGALGVVLLLSAMSYKFFEGPFVRAGVPVNLSRATIRA
jgi:peptidoglycan/LPS O-acetylase OafA/YrhL